VNPTGQERLLVPLLVALRCSPAPRLHEGYGREEAHSGRRAEIHVKSPEMGTLPSAVMGRTCRPSGNAATGASPRFAGTGAYSSLVPTDRPDPERASQRVRAEARRCWGP